METEACYNPLYVKYVTLITGIYIRVGRKHTKISKETSQYLATYVIDVVYKLLDAATAILKQRLTEKTREGPPVISFSDITIAYEYIKLYEDKGLAKEEEFFRDLNVRLHDNYYYNPAFLTIVLDTLSCTIKGAPGISDRAKIFTKLYTEYLIEEIISKAAYLMAPTSENLTREVIKQVIALNEPER